MVAMLDGDRAVTRLSRRQVLAIFGAGVGTAVVASGSNDMDGGGPETGGTSLQAGASNMAGLNRVGERLWKGPNSVRSDVPKEDGNDFIATDAGPNNDQYELYHYSGGSWQRQGFKLRELTLVDQA